jgi:hypothetical protein
LKPVLQPWKIHRSNAKLYGAGVLAQGDTAASNPMYGQIATNPLAGASLGLQLPGSGSTQIGTKFYAGMMILTYMVRFVSIKPSTISCPPPVPPSFNFSRPSSEAPAREPQ